MAALCILIAYAIVFAVAAVGLWQGTKLRRSESAEGETH